MQQPDSKFVLKSKAIIGALMTVAPTVATILFPALAVEQVVAVVKLIEATGVVLAVYGLRVGEVPLRLRPRKKIKRDQIK